jgi:sugar phosphate isomerase/epimerase
MKRRTFIKHTTLTSTSTIFAPFVFCGRQNSGEKNKDKMNRIGMSTVIFRNRFIQTVPQNQELRDELKLFDIPEFFQDRFNMSLVEFWSRHFESLEESYLKELGQKVKQAKCRLINIQCDQPYSLSDENEEKRQEGVALVKQWMDAAVMVGAEAIRANPGRGQVEKAIASLRELNSYAIQKGLIFMTENHFGLNSDPEVHIRITKEVGTNNFYTLPDFGNYEDAIRYQALQKIMPYAYQVSAKVIKFNKAMEHISFDFDRCMKIAEESGFKGIYSIEQWDQEYQPENFEAVADWVIERIKLHIT